MKPGHSSSVHGFSATSNLDGSNERVRPTSSQDSKSEGAVPSDRRRGESSSQLNVPKPRREFSEAVAGKHSSEARNRKKRQVLWSLGFC